MAEAGTSQPCSEASSQEVEFDAICDQHTGMLLHPIGSAEGQAILGRLNRATERTAQGLTQVLKYAVGCNLAQGVCLLAAVFKEIDLLTPVWSGPPCALEKDSVQVLMAFSKVNAKKV